MIERDVVAWIVDGGTIIGTLVAIGVAWRAILDSKRTATELAEGRRLLEAAQERAEREQAARVLTVGQDLSRRIQIYWQPTLVQLDKPFGPGAANALLGHAREDLAVAEELVLRCSGVDLVAVQYARYVRWELESILERLEAVERRAIKASPGGGEKPDDVQQHTQQWESLRPKLIGRTVAMLEVLQRLESHFPAAARVLSGTDTQGFMEDLHRELQQGRDAKVSVPAHRGRSLPGERYVVVIDRLGYPWFL